MPPPTCPTEVLAELLSAGGTTVAVAESLTCGQLAAELGRAPGASDWFLGGVVAYAARTKFDVLGVPPGPVVSATAAAAMAESVWQRFGAGLTLAVTGVGGPGPESGTPAGTVWFALRHAGGHEAHLRHFAGDPTQVLDATVSESVRLLLAASRRGGPRELRDGTPYSGNRQLPSPVAGDLPVTPTWPH